MTAEHRRLPNETFVNSPSVQSLRMLRAAITKAKSIDPVKVAKAMEGLTITSLGNEITMRAADHQLQMPLYVFSWGKVHTAHSPNEVEKTGNTWVLDRKIEAFVASTPTSCQMKRPN
jgi:branched-chain amino acid transport system substrate-binding protein